jgi:hypothetical protein
MTTQAETLTLAAQVVDQFSAPLRNLTKQLKAFSSLQGDTNRAGKRDVDRHWQSYRDLNKQVTETASSTKKLLQPAIEALGLSSAVAFGSLAGLAKGLRDLGAHAETLGYLRTETGLTAQQFREFEAAGVRVGIGVEQTDGALKKFAENLNQYKRGHGDFIKSLEVFRERPDLMAFARSLAGMPVTDAIESLRSKLGTLKGEERALVECAFELPEGFGRETDDMMARVRGNLGTLTEASAKDLREMQGDWHDLQEAIDGASIAIETHFAKSLGIAYSGLADFAKQHPYIAAIATSFAGIAKSVGEIAGAASVFKYFLGGAAAGPTTAAAAGAGGVARWLGFVGGGIAAGAAAAGPGGIAAALLLGGSTALNIGEDERAQHRKYISGLGRGHRALMERGALHPISGSFADIAQGLRSEETTYKAVLRGTREGTIEAFQWLKRLQEGGGAGGGIISASYHPGEGGSGIGGGAAGAGGSASGG